MAPMGKIAHTLALVVVALGCTQARTLADPKPPEVVPGEGALVSIEATDASVLELVRMLSRAADVKVVLAAMPDKLVTVKLPAVSADVAVQAICDAAGLKLTKRDGIFVIGPGNIRVEVSSAGPATQSTWRTWDGQLSEDTATRAFEPQRTNVKDGSRLTGTLGDLVEDLKAAGADISVDPSATLGVLDSPLELPWHGGRNTVEAVLLRWALSARSGPLGTALLQWLDEGGQATDRLRIVPGDRWTDLSSLGNAYTRYGLAFRQTPSLPLYVPEGGRLQFNLYSDNLYAWPPGEVPAPLQAKIDLDLTDVPLTEALKAIEAKLGKPVTLAEGVKADTKVSVHAEGAPIIQVLTDVLRPLGLTITYARGEEFSGVTVIPGPPWLGPNLPFSLYFSSPDR